MGSRLVLSFSVKEYTMMFRICTRALLQTVTLMTIFLGALPIAAPKTSLLNRRGVSHITGTEKKASLTVFGS